MIDTEELKNTFPFGPHVVDPMTNLVYRCTGRVDIDRDRTHDGRKLERMHIHVVAASGKHIRVALLQRIDDKSRDGFMEPVRRPRVPQFAWLTYKAARAWHKHARPVLANALKL